MPTFSSGPPLLRRSPARPRRPSPTTALPTHRLTPTRGHQRDRAGPKRDPPRQTAGSRRVGHVGILL
eukprot:3138059-Lingulodinium_polyedra.AAC.1